MGKNNTWVADHWWNHVAKPQTAEAVYMSASSQPLGGDSIQERWQKITCKLYSGYTGCTSFMSDADKQQTTVITVLSVTHLHGVLVLILLELFSVLYSMSP